MPYPRLRAIGPLALGCWMLWLGAAVAQDKSLPADFAAKLKAFDADVVGDEGLAIDIKAVSVAYDPLDWDIAKMEEEIDHDKELISLAQSRDNPTQRQAEVDEFTRDMNSDQNRLEALKMRKKLGDADGQCGSAEKIKQWQDLIDFEQKDIAIEQGYVSESRMSDVRAYFENAVVRGRIVLNEAISQLTVIKQACEQAHDEAILDTYKQHLAQANTVAEKAGSDAIAIAARGHFADSGEIRKDMAVLLPVLLANELMGNEDVATKQLDLVNTVLSTFARAAQSACMDEAFNVMQALEVQRQVELLGLTADLSPCMNRLYEGGGGKIDANSFFAFRHCGTTFSGDWEARMVSKTENLSGQAQTTGIVTVDSDGAGTVKLSGRITPADNVTLPYEVVQTGTVKFTMQEVKSAQGIVTGSWPHIITQLTTQSHETTFIVTGHKHTVTVPAVDELENDDNLVIINDDKPCDPAKDVWGKAK